MLMQQCGEAQVFHSSLDFYSIDPVGMQIVLDTLPPDVQVVMDVGGTSWKAETLKVKPSKIQRDISKQLKAMNIPCGSFQLTHLCSRTKADLQK